MGAPSITVDSLHPALGGEVRGVDLAIHDDDHIIGVLRQALLDYGVIVMRGQTLSPSQQIVFSKKFGPLMEHVVGQFNMNEYPEVLILSNDKNQDGSPVGIEDAGRYWHTDMSYLSRPSLGSILHAIEVPPEGGETMFASMCSAYESLSEEYKQKLQGLRAVHFFGARWHKEMGKSGVRPAMTEEQLAETPPVTHPLIRTHPETGRKAVYAGGFAVGIEGWEDKLAAEQFLDEINTFSTQQQFIFTHKWQSGDIVFWDNRCTMHHAKTYPQQYRRHMHRTTIRGDRPY